ncbi:MAG: diguanylate cyclase [Pseudomonadota bacterium]
MTDSTARLQEKLRLLAVSYAEKLPDKINQIEQMWGQLQIEWDEEILQTLQRMVHSLTGSGKIFGFAELSGVARVLEESLKGMVKSKTPANEQQCVQIQKQIEDLRQAASHASPIQREISAPAKTTAAAAGFRGLKQVFVAEDDCEVAQELALQLRHFGYEVRVFNQLDEFRLAVKQAPDVIILMDIEFHEDRLAGIKAMEEIQQERAMPAPVIFISAYDDLASRLGAVRAGSVAYFTKPVNPGELIDQLDALTSSQPQQPFRVLIVDDDAAMLAYHSAVLEQAGMLVSAVNKPMEIMGALLEFDPDLVLMDMYMPECDGIELAKVIRQLGGFVGVPIVYLSAEKDFNKQFEAVSFGGDDFLVKPIGPQHLVSAITSRIQRTRLLRSFMVRDSLTGLLNHTSIKDQLGREVARAHRLKTPLAFAMIDIDFFKNVNDSYGHAAGDRVIKSLARLLKQRLRETDIVGRYGGEEFAVIMTGTDGPSAVKVLDSIRDAFSRLIHLSEGKEFSVNLSCGIADIVHFGDAIKIGDAADKALYQAKQAGRNQVVLAQA